MNILRILTAAALFAVVGLSAQPQQPAVSIVSPHDGDYVSGPVTLKAEVQPPDVQVKSLSLFADGRLVCTLERPPYECPWDAGRRVVEHALRAVAVLADGRRVARGVRTRGVPYTEAVDVDVVHITASVTDGSGRFVKGLARTWPPG